MVLVVWMAVMLFVEGCSAVYLYYFSFAFDFLFVVEVLLKSWIEVFGTAVIKEGGK
jgi:hypothetical protein